MRCCIVVPTYWSRPSTEGWKEADLVFDHPTPLDGQDTLGRFLDSLSVLEDTDFDLSLVVVPTAAEISNQSVGRVRDIAQQSSSPVKPSLLTVQSLDRISGMIGERAGQLAPVLSLGGYPHVRNACLLAAHLLGADVAVLIDDDEVFELPDFLAKVREGIGADFEGRPIRALAGYYLQPGGGFLLERQSPGWAARWPQAEVMDEAFEQIIGSGPRYKRTPFVFGGNMSLHRELFTDLPFDTSVTRGEDIDYLMMALAAGVPTILDNELHIRHLAPPKSHPLWQRLRQDFIRFAYQRAKLDRLRSGSYSGMKAVRPEDLDPYPGLFLRPDLDDRIEATADALAQELVRKSEQDAAREALAGVQIARQAASSGTDPIESFLDLRRRWRELIELTADDGFKQVLE